MDLDLDSLDLKGLKDLRGRVEKAIATFEDRRKRNVMAEIEEVARKHGFSFSELAQSAGGRPGKKTPSVARYANPANSAQTWSGRGRKPGWVSEALASGKKLGNLEI